MLSLRKAEPIALSEGTIPACRQSTTYHQGHLLLLTSGGSCQHKGQILQMLTDMKEQMKEQQIRSDRDREHVTIDRKNAFREKEALKHRNDKLHVQIIALQRVQEQKQPKSECGIERLRPKAHYEFEVAQTNVPYKKTTPTTRPIHLISKQKLIITKLGEELKNLPTSKSSTS